MIYTFIKLSLIIKELEANEISTLKNLWCILKTTNARLGIYVGHNKSQCFKLNWIKIYKIMERLFESWKKRK